MLPPPGTPGTDLPVRHVLQRMVDALHEAGTAILLAPPGSGKTSLLPLALADALTGRIIVAEPRRIATRAAASRMAYLLNEQVGHRVGYAMRGARRVGPATQVEVVTTGLLVRRLLADPELAGVSAVIIDEAHERTLDTDLALAFCLDVRANLRPDLKLVATSATAQGDRLAAVLGSLARPAPIVLAQGTQYPVEVIFVPPIKSLPLLADARVDPRLLDHVATVVRRALLSCTGDVLVFLPGEAEIGGMAQRLADIDNVVRLYGRQSAAEQDAVLQPSEVRRVVLSTAIAESSLTVPGVSTVVDAGLSREPRIDVGRGLGMLTTAKVAQSSATQRAGRAGREGPGRVYRCWSEMDDTHLSEHPLPEIATADLTSFALSVAAWGHPRGIGLSWLDQPPTQAMAAAQLTLLHLDAVDERGDVTARGRQLAAIATAPRLANALLDAGPILGSGRAAELVALISENISIRGGDDLVARWRDLRRGTDQAATAQWRLEAKRLAAAVASTSSGRETEVITDDSAAALVVGLAFPDRLARRRPGGTAYLMTGGSGAELSPSTELSGSPWLAIAVADRPTGKSAAQIRLAAPIDQATALVLAAHMSSTTREIGWQDGALVMREKESLGAIELRVRPLTHPDPSEVVAAVREGVTHSGLDILSWPASSLRLRSRLALLHQAIGDPWCLVTDEALLAQLDDWLGPDLSRVRSAADIARIDTTTALRRLLPWPAAAQLDQLAPERVQVPSGTWVRVDYTAVDFAGHGAPVLAVRVQQVFGWLQAPVIAGGAVPVVLHLLSPRGRPTAITSDLASFWLHGYPQVRAEFRSRYPRHSWPVDPTTATPTKRVS